MPSNIRELAREREETEWDIRDQLQATRVYLYDPDDPAGYDETLPEAFEPFPDKPWLLASNMQKQLFEGHPDKHLYTVTYEPLPPELEGTYGGSEPRTIDTAIKGVTIGGELFALASTGEAILWETGGQPVPKEVKLSQRIITGTIRVETETTNFTAYAREIARQAGKVNSKTFLGIQPESVLFAGAQLDPEQRLNDQGTEYIQYWRIGLAYAFRIIPLPGGGTGGWQHHWNPKTGLWDRTNPKTYQTSGNFEALV